MHQIINCTNLLQNHLGDATVWRSCQTYPQKTKIERLIHELELLKVQDSSEYYVLHCLSDAYFILGDYHNALLSCPQPDFKQKWSLLANRRINLTILAGENVSVYDLLALFSKRVTKYGLENIDLISQISGVLLSEWETSQKMSIREFIINKFSDTPKIEHMLFNGTLFVKSALENVQFYNLEYFKELESLVTSLSREAENIVREDKGMPRIGEGWISETKLFYEIKQILPDDEVIFHARPEWLGRQHLDIYIPKFSLAFEYQGIQHSKPVEYFGGNEAFIHRQKLDNKKQNLCNKNKVRIIYIEEGYDLDTIKLQIEQHIETIQEK